MSEELRALEAEVARFRAWADDNYPPEDRLNEWEWDYRDWSSLYRAFEAFVTTIPCRDWDDVAADLLLYAIARDNDSRWLDRQVAKDTDNLLYLAERAVSSAEPDAKYQLAVQLAHLDPPPAQAESLLLRFAGDEDDYVRRRAVMALADLGSTCVDELVGREWDTTDEYQRMGVLYALWKVGSPQLDRYLEQADSDGRGYLADYAARIRAGNPE